MAMDPNPKKFPILSYVLKSETDSDSLPLPTEQLMEKMPNLKDPKVLASMTRAVSDIAQTRSVLQTLGDRPDHKAVDVACAKIVEVGSSLSKQLERIVLGPRPENVDRLKWRAQQAAKEKGCRLAAEKERRIYKAVVELDELHNAYEKLLRDAEERLEKIYGSTETVLVREEKGESSSGLWEVNDEVVEILQYAMGKGLESVELPRRQLRFLPEAFGKLCGLLVLNLSGNLLEVIPDSIAGLEKLQELYLSSNLLQSLPDSIGLLLNLKILDVSGNKLTSLPDSISHCRSLVELDTSYNSLTYLPTNIGYELVNLQRLSIHLNKIRSLPTSISLMRSLRHLDAHFNELHCLPHSIGRLTNLENLNISSNFSDLTELPDTIGDLINLRELDLSHNQIQSLPDTFGRVNSLTKLDLDQNPLIIPPMEVVDKGVEAVKVFMAKRWLDILLEEERRRMLEAQAGWRTQSTSWLNNWVSGVSRSVAGFLGAGGKSPKDPFLDQQL